MSWLFRKLFFNRNVLFFLCFFSMVISYICDSKFGGKGLFPASGTILTLSGIMLNIKATNIFHLRQGDKPLNIQSKLAIIKGNGIFSSSTPDAKASLIVKSVENDEKSGLLLIIFGTLLWGYGHLFI